MTQVAREVFGHDRVAALSGPSHAEEVGRRVPTAVVVASEDGALARHVQGLFTSERFRLYTSSDVAGVEFGGAFKNVIAVAVGVSDGLGFGDNTRAALITRGLVEITRLGCALGAREKTFAGLSGMGDLVVTCTSRHSRNRHVGEELGRGRKIEEILGAMKQAAEGAWNCRAVHALAQQHGIQAPIAAELHAILYEGKDPADAVRSLMTRDAKPE
jgi:glycerol-3-phosphate dehydrogenase (NAD(P)+)